MLSIKILNFFNQNQKLKGSEYVRCCILIFYDEATSTAGMFLILAMCLGSSKEDKVCSPLGQLQTAFTRLNWSIGTEGQEVMHPSWRIWEQVRRFPLQALESAQHTFFVNFALCSMQGTINFALALTAYMISRSLLSQGGQQQGAK